MKACGTPMLRADSLTDHHYRDQDLPADGPGSDVACVWTRAFILYR
jgi:hypothetical protein